MAEQEVLLLADSDPGIPGSLWWVLPGGGIDDGETEAAAACRELFEETGLQLSPEQLSPPIARRRVIHGYSDRILIQDEVFFRVEVAKFEPSTANLTQRETERSKGSGWFGLDALPQPVWPAEVAKLANWQGSELQLGEVEESTVAVLAGDS